MKGQTALDAATLEARIAAATTEQLFESALVRTRMSLELWRRDVLNDKVIEDLRLARAYIDGILQWFPGSPTKPPPLAVSPP